MRTFLNGSGVDVTLNTRAYLAASRQLLLADLYVISTAPNYSGFPLGQTFYLTDYPSNLSWAYRGIFHPGVISRGEVESKIGLEADKLEVTWSPNDVLMYGDDGSVLLTALQAFGAGIFDNGNLEVWRTIMPTPGDCDTCGACLMFAGRIGDLEPDRMKIKMSVLSRMETLNVQVPTNLIEPTNIWAQYITGQIPTGGPSSFTVVPGSSAVKIYADAAVTMAAGSYDSGYIVMASGKLGGSYRGVRAQTVESGHHAFYLYEPLPFAPAVGDTLEAYVPVPRDDAGAIAVGTKYAGAPFVPSPVSSAVVIA